jgi:hypothetical protein
MSHLINDYREELLGYLKKFSESGDKSHVTQVAIFAVLKELCPSLSNSLPCDGDTFGTWCLQEDMPSFEDDRNIVKNVLGHEVHETGLMWQGGPPKDPLLLDIDMLRYYAPRGDETKIFERTSDILKRRCPSLMRTERGNPPTWTLDAYHDSCLIDSDFIRKNLPKHKVCLVGEKV